MTVYEILRDPYFLKIRRLIPGPCDDPYFINRKDRAEVRIAHIGPSPQRKIGRGVFIRVVSARDGIAIQRQGAIMPINRRTISGIIRTMKARYEETQVRHKLVTHVQPNRRNMLSVGRVESNRRRH